MSNALHNARVTALDIDIDKDIDKASNPGREYHPSFYYLVWGER